MKTETKYQTQMGPVVSFETIEGHTAEQAHMHRAFALVCPSHWNVSGDWKDEVRAVITDADLEAVGVTLQDVAKSVSFFTATESYTQPLQTLKGETVYVVRAKGYRAGPAA